MSVPIHKIYTYRIVKHKILKNYFIQRKESDPYTGKELENSEWETMNYCFGKREYDHYVELIRTWLIADHDSKEDNHFEVSDIFTPIICEYCDSEIKNDTDINPCPPPPEFDNYDKNCPPCDRPRRYV